MNIMLEEYKIPRMYMSKIHIESNAAQKLLLSCFTADPVNAPADKIFRAFILKMYVETSCNSFILDE